MKKNGQRVQYPQHPKTTTGNSTHLTPITPYIEIKAEIEDHKVEPTVLPPTARWETCK